MIKVNELSFVRMMSILRMGDVKEKEQNGNVQLYRL